jgi:6-phosphogluconate dehydrogenase (decarboxylating)
VKCFHCHEHGHLATNYPQKRKNKMVVGAATSEALVSQFELKFSLITCMDSSASGSVWYLDSGASFLMTGDKESFSDLEEKYLRMHIEMGDDG